MVEGLNRVLTNTGIVILLAFIASAILLMNAAFDTGQRGFALGALAASCWLEITWIFVAVSLAIIRWRATTVRFWAIPTINAIVGILLARDFFLHYRPG